MTSYAPVQLAHSSVEPEDCAKDKVPIIFIHGVTASKENWNDIPQMTARATKRKVYAIDARNHGDSEWSDTFNFDCNVDDLLSFMDTMDIPKAILVGHSMGGVTGMKTALRAPERVERLVVEDISLRQLPQPVVDIVINFVSLGKAAIDQMPAGLEEDAAQKFIMEYMFKNVPPQFPLPMKKDPSAHRLQLKRTSNGRYTYKSNIEAIMKALKDLKHLITEPTEGQFEGPTCFIYGTLSPFLVGKDQEFLKKFFPNSEFVGIENAAHTVHIDFPEDFVETLLKFLLKE